MLKLHVVQAEEGDCLILEFGTESNARHILVDGGPAQIYRRHLRGELRKIKERGGRLDLVILSHVDDDHVAGILDLMTEVREQRDRHAAEMIKMKALWHNAFSQTIGRDNDIQARLEMRLAAAGSARRVMTRTDTVALSIRQGDQLRSAAEELRIPINAGFPNDLISADGAPHQPVKLGGLGLYVVGPTESSLREFKNKWIKWLREAKDRRLAANASLASKVDSSIPNLSSIMVVAEMKGKRVLLAGDGLSDHLIRGLGQANLLGSDGTLHVDVLKVPHHGSIRNIRKKEFFKTVTADKYVISANGKDGNPDLTTLTWIVRAAKEQGRSIEILTTNETASTKQLAKKYSEDDYGYRLRQMKKGSHSMTVQIAD